MHIKSGTIGKDHLHPCFSSLSPGWRDTLVHRDCLACSTSAGKRQHFVVPTGIRVQLCHRLIAPTQHDLATSLEETILCLLGDTDEGQLIFMLRGAPRGYDSFVAFSLEAVLGEDLPP